MSFTIRNQALKLDLSPLQLAVIMLGGFLHTLVFLMYPIFTYARVSYPSHHTYPHSCILSYPHVLSSCILSYPILSYPILSYPILMYPILSYPILSYPHVSYPILSYPILSYPILSYPHVSYHFLSSIFCQMAVNIQSG